MKIHKELLKYIAPQASDGYRLKIATGAEPLDGIAPHDLVTLLFVLSYDKNPDVSAAAKKGFEESPLDVICSALEKKLDPVLIEKLVSMRGDKDAVLILAALNEGTSDKTLAVIAEKGPEEALAVLAEDRRLLEKPFIMEAVNKNPLVTRGFFNPVVPVPKAQSGAPLEPQKKTELSELEKDAANPAKADEHNIYKLVQGLSVAQKIKLAISGNKSAREFLVKESNKMISTAVLKNPRITEDEVMKIIYSKGTPEDLLRQVARNKEWLKNYSIKLGMVVNARTPLALSIKMLDTLNDADIVKIARSKNIPSTLASAARRKLDVKAKKK